MHFTDGIKTETFFAPFLRLCILAFLLGIESKMLPLESPPAGRSLLDSCCRALQRLAQAAHAQQARSAMRIAR